MPDSSFQLLINTYDEGSKTSLYTIFLVWTPSSSGILPFCTNSFVVNWETPLDNATYTWPWLKTWSGRQIPIVGIVRPCTLFIVIAKLKRIGNCRLIITNGRCTFYVVYKGILGKKMRVHTYCLVKISASIMLLKHPRPINLVPLHNSTFGSILRNNIIGAPLFSLNICGGKPLRGILVNIDVEYRLQPHQKNVT